MSQEKNINEFNKDVNEHGGYAYTGDRLSSILANRRITDAILSLSDLRGKRVIDIGCGDGTYTLELLNAGAQEVLGVDAAASAIDCARKRAETYNNVRFETADIYDLDAYKGYDIAILRGILHHLYDVEKAVENICKVADEVVIVEPNGYNPILKVIEKISPYHVEHEEKSYAPHKLNRWFESQGGRVVKAIYIGLVPMFCPDFLARTFKALEPVVEKIPLLRNISCGQYVSKIRL